jgi:hypothetical protein
MSLTLNYLCGIEIIIFIFFFRINAIFAWKSIDQKKYSKNVFVHCNFLFGENRTISDRYFQINQSAKVISTEQKKTVHKETQTLVFKFSVTSFETKITNDNNYFSC